MTPFSPLLTSGAANSNVTPAFAGEIELIDASTEKLKKMLIETARKDGIPKNKIKSILLSAKGNLPELLNAKDKEGKYAYVTFVNLCQLESPITV